MPHSTETEMSTPTINGDKSFSKTIDHLSSYPVISDGIETFKSNPYGRKSIELADSAYARFGKPVEPYFETPKQYVAPYAKKADELADSGLSRVETTFPIVKEDTSTIVDYGKSLAWWPFKVVGDGKDYVVTTYNDEYTKTAKHNGRGAGVTTFVLAVFSTELKIASDFFQAVADFLGPKYEEGKKQIGDAVHHAQETAEEYKKFGEQKVEELKKEGAARLEQAKGEAAKAKEEAQKKAQK